jgi:hypothetical protein
LVPPMSDPLTRHMFSEDDLPDVQDFHCGDEPYEKEVADWLKGPDEPGVDCAVNSIKDPDQPSRVWLYKVGEKIVGFGSLAKSKWRWPGKNNDGFVPLSVIIWVGVPKEFWGKPEGPKEERYSAKILDDLLAEADSDAKTHSVLGLFVHKDNHRAIKFYKNSGFNDELVQRVDKEYVKMFVVLDDEAFEAAVEAAKASRGKKK